MPRPAALLLLAIVAVFVATNAVADQPLRIATYNASLNRGSAGALAAELSSPGSNQPGRIAEVIQRINPDVLLINEFDYDPSGQAVEDFLTNYLGVSQNGLEPVEYDYWFSAPSNTGVQPEDELGEGFDFDFNNNGQTDNPDDAFGFGNFAGQYGMLVLSKHPIADEGVRTFQKFLWQDMPGAFLPDNLSTPETPADWYSPEELAAFRLSSKSHWDVPVEVAGETVHLLASHPTPPVFDGAEDRNGLRNHDEIRFWADYIDPSASGYIYDDEQFDLLGATPAEPTGGLAAGESFVILGDQNADPDEGDSSMDAAQQLTDHPLINNTFSPGGGFGPDPDDTAAFTGGLRVDYVLPSLDLTVVDDDDHTGVFWPLGSDPQFGAMTATDHRLVYVDFVIETLGGDYNFNGVVDAADFTVWRDNFGATGLVGMPGDGDDGTGLGSPDGVVDMADYDYWVAQFGQTLPGPAASVPEPAAAVLVLLAAPWARRRVR
ncbi:hypothetical protein Mal64_01600 [Pseudobythopirellula maris]|uniref:Endonuclease/exonuclease/phosphatase domain-containing protein n=1 Tax=Pseudobythopirellula maris TaxID=2527991 RepID=A0A5C5ZSN2_9BACT|nr:endonuclease/exonuclease/phosphatase family protein [Pseudobythopirellula maris]TWT89781.1 hypothetical protein Mal64_01600 [Pseudobythopirellula maris]